ncbi:hypothetical protein VTH06DRAFT_4683 [Thermothelomyces fergusii]
MAGPALLNRLWFVCPVLKPCECADLICPQPVYPKRAKPGIWSKTKTSISNQQSNHHETPRTSSHCRPDDPMVRKENTY